MTDRPICQACLKETQPFAELGLDGGVIQKCGNLGCYARLESAAPVSPAPRPPLRLAAAAPAPVLPLPVGAKPVQATLDLDAIITLARERLVRVDAELAHLAELEIEAGQLRRMIAASQPQATRSAA